MGRLWAGGKLRRLRKLQGLTQPQVAEAIGVQTPTVSRWEAGRGPSEQHRRQLCVLLQCDIADLMDDLAQATLTPDESALLAAFRAASEADRQTILAIASRLAARQGKLPRRQILCCLLVTILVMRRANERRGP